MVYFMCPFENIFGLEEKDDELKGGAKPSWGPKSDTSLIKDNRFLELIEVKFGELIGNLLIRIHNDNLIVSKRK